MPTNRSKIHCWILIREFNTSENPTVMPYKKDACLDEFGAPYDAECLWANGVFENSDGFLPTDHMDLQKHCAHEVQVPWPHGSSRLSDNINILGLIGKTCLLNYPHDTQKKRLTSWRPTLICLSISTSSNLPWRVNGTSGTPIKPDPNWRRLEWKKCKMYNISMTKFHLYSVAHPLVRHSLLCLFSELWVR